MKSKYSKNTIKRIVHKDVHKSVHKTHDCEKTMFKRGKVFVLNPQETESPIPDLIMINTSKKQRCFFVREIDPDYPPLKLEVL